MQFYSLSTSLLDFGFTADGLRLALGERAAL